MTKTELNKLIALGEGLHLEYKKSVSHLGREMCAFANTSGGKILIGVSDDGTLVGVLNINRAKSEIQNAARSMEPSLTVNIETVQNALVVTVPSGPDKPYSSNGKFYLRDAATCQQMKRTEIREYFFKEGVIRWDEQICRAFSPEKDIATGKYRAFLRLTSLPIGLGRREVLANLGVLTDEGMTNAGVLLFAKQVTRFHLQASIICAVFQGTSKTKILDKQEYGGGIPESYENAISYLTSHLNTEYIIRGGPRQEILELPDNALREAVLNALAHRDYRSTACIQIHIFQDRVEVVNPGGLVPGLRMRDLGKVSRPRNVFLFSLMERMDLVEKVGSGIKRIRTAMRESGLEKPEIESDGDWFSITFFRKPQQVSIEDTTQKTTQNSATQKTTQKRRMIAQKARARIVELMKENPLITTDSLAQQLDMTRHGVRYHLNKLEAAGVISRVGPDRGGFWQVQKK